MNNLLANIGGYVAIGVAVLLLFVGLIIFVVIRIEKKSSNQSRMKENYAKLKIGMSKEEVISLLGQPTGIRTRNGVETLTWKQSEWKGIFRGGSIVRSIVADFEKGLLTGYDSENMDKSRF